MNTQPCPYAPPTPESDHSPTARNFWVTSLHRLSPPLSLLPGSSVTDHAGVRWKRFWDHDGAPVRWWSVISWRECAGVLTLWVRVWVGIGTMNGVRGQNQGVESGEPGGKPAGFTTLLNSSLGEPAGNNVARRSRSSVSSSSTTQTSFSRPPLDTYANKLLLPSPIAFLSSSSQSCPISKLSPTLTLRAADKCIAAGYE